MTILLPRKHAGSAKQKALWILPLFLKNPTTDFFYDMVDARQLPRPNEGPVCLLRNPIKKLTKASEKAGDLNPFGCISMLRT